MPLQRAGVLELVDQQVPDAGIQSLLNPARQVVVCQQCQSDALEVGHVDQVALLLESSVGLEQLARQANHCAVVFVRVGLGELRADAVERFADHGLRRQLAQLLARRAVAALGEQGATQTQIDLQVVGRGQAVDQQLRCALAKGPVLVAARQLPRQ